ncbi:uncharacterized protein LOC142541744 [Primulina tabacum]|uniref:uncharacterized protein LOC142541744 n=1 Tax=Primulina tabacum TaxID=48773 RepID=UPI003F5A1975
MAQATLISAVLVLLAPYSFMLIFVSSQPPLDAVEQEAVYRVLESINSGIQWRTLFPDDICASAPHGIVCNYFSDYSAAGSAFSAHVTELSFGYVSEYSPNPPCGFYSTFQPSLLTPLPYLNKLFFYKCFTEKKIPFPDFSPLLSSSLEELIFIENPGLSGSLDGRIGNFSSLRRLVLTGTSVSGKIPRGFGELINIEQLTLSRSKFEGEISANIFQNLQKLKVLGLSENGFKGSVPESIGNLTDLLKLDLSHNEFSGRIPEMIKNLNSLEFLDLSYNRFGNFGVPLFLSGMPSLKEVHLSGNFLGGQIPEIWGNLGGILGIGLSGVGLLGKIPKSMAMNLKFLCYLALDNNRLEGIVPEEFGALEFVTELNLENNNLTGRVPFSAELVSKLGKKLKLEGNSDLCIDEGLRSAKFSGVLGQLKVCRQQPDIPQTALLFENFYPRRPRSYALIFLWFVFSWFWF